MRRLILMRHAKSDWSHAGLQDHERPLNARGIRSATALGDWLRRQGHVPAQILCSYATRTQETLARLALDPDTPTDILRALYLSEAPEMLRILRAAEGQSVLMIAHNGGIADMAHDLLRTAPQHNRFDDYPTGATLVCDFDVDSWNEIGWRKGQPIDFITPRDLE